MQEYSSCFLEKKESLAKFHVKSTANLAFNFLIHKKMAFYLCSYLTNMFLFGIFLPNFCLSLSNKAIVSLENSCPFHVLVFVMNTQHSPSA